MTNIYKRSQSIPRTARNNRIYPGEYTGGNAPVSNGTGINLDWVSVTPEKVTINRDTHIEGNLTASEEVVAWVAGAVTSDVLAGLTATAPLRKSSASNIVLDYNTGQFEVVSGNLQIKSGILTPSAHTHLIADVTGLQSALDSKQASLNGTGLVRMSGATVSYDNSTYITGITKSMVEAVLTGNITSHIHSQYLTANQTITLSGIITGSGTTAITTAIADGALSIAKTSGLQTALDAKMATASYPDLVAIEALTGTSGLLKKTAANTWSLDTNTYLTANQPITLSGQATGSGTTAITVTLGNASVSAKVLTGYTATSGTISATDSLLTAIQKLGYDKHVSVTIGTANGLSLSTQTLSLALASTSITGALSSTDWNTFNSKQPQLNGTGLVRMSGATVSYDNTSYLPLAGGTMSNTNLVSNLNADFLDGLHSSSFTKFAGAMLNVDLNDYFGDRREIWDYQHGNGAVTNHPPGADGYGTMVIEGTPNFTTQIYYSAQQEMFFRTKYNPSTAPTWTKVWTDKNLDPSNVNSESLYVNYEGNFLRISPRSSVCYLQSYSGGFEFSGFGGAAAPVARFTLVDNDSLFVNSYKVWNAGNSNKSDVDWVTKNISVNGSASITGNLTAQIATLTGCNSQSFIVKNSSGTNQWTISYNTSTNALEFKNASGVLECSIDQSGNLKAKGEVTAYATI